MVKCPNCSKDNNKPKKKWHYGPKYDPKKMLVQYYPCSCGTIYLAWKRPNSTTVRVVGKRK